jgi:WD40 repeat protein
MQRSNPMNESKAASVPSEMRKERLSPGNPDSDSYEFDFSPQIVTSDADCSIIIWNSKGEPKNIFRGHSKGITVLTIYDPADGSDADGSDADGSDVDGSSPIIISGSEDCSLILWDLQTCSKITQLPKEGDKGHTKAVTSVQVFCREKGLPIIVSASEDGNVIMWDLVTGRKIRSLQGFDSSVPIAAMKVYQAKWDSGLLRVLTAGSVQHGAFSWWDLSNRPLSQTYEHIAQVVSLTIYQPPGDVEALTIIAFINKQCKIFSMTDHRELLILVGHTERLNGVVAVTPPLYKSKEEPYDVLIATVR